MTPDIPDHLAGIIRICHAKRIGLLQASQIIASLLVTMWADVGSLTNPSEHLH